MKKEKMSILEFKKQYIGNFEPQPFHKELLKMMDSDCKKVFIPSRPRRSPKMQYFTTPLLEKDMLSKMFQESLNTGTCMTDVSIKNNRPSWTIIDDPVKTIDTFEPLQYPKELFLKIREDIINRIEENTNKGRI